MYALDSCDVTTLTLHELLPQRLCVINENVPGVLGAITTLLGDLKLNIKQTVNTSRNDIAYRLLLTKASPNETQAARRSHFVCSLNYDACGINRPFQTMHD